MPWVDIVDDYGRKIGHLDEDTMRVVAPNPVVDGYIASGKSIFMFKNGIKSILSVRRDKKGRPI